MKQRHVSIAAAALAALVVGIGPAIAQTSPSDSPSTPGGSVTISPNVSPNTNDESPSASPRGDDDKASKPDDHGDRQKMKDQERIDKKSGLERADDAAGDRGGYGRDTADTRGTRR
jgi:hypothetical protein